MKLGKLVTQAKRVLAATLAALLVIGVIPISTKEVAAETENHDGFITIMVQDTSDTPIAGATVTYTIEKDSSIVEQGEKNTGEDGIVNVLASTSWVDGLKINATVTKTSYQSKSISNESITSNNQQFVVKLEPESSAEPSINATVTVLNGTYQEGIAQDLVTRVVPDVEGATIEYSTDGSTWDTTVPTATNAGDYPVYIKVTKDGYTPFESGELTAKITKADISEISLTANTLYYDGSEQELVSYSGTLPGDTITWEVNNQETGSPDIPKKMAVGSYSVKLTVKRDSNYNDCEKTIIATINNGTIDLGDLQVKGVKTIYDGTAKKAVIVENKGDYDLKYQIGASVSDAAWQDEIPEVTNAGSYIVWVKAVKAYYDDKEVEVTPAEGVTTPYNVLVEKASQILTFNNTFESSYNVEIDELYPNGKTFDFSATDETEYVADSTITYSLEIPEGSEENCATIDSSGILKFTEPGEVKVKAVLSGDDNYAECEITQTISVKLLTNADGELIKFEKVTVNYVLGENNGVVSENKATKKKNSYRGTIRHSIENADALGLACDTSSGKITVSDYSKLINAIADANGTLVVTVKADKDATLFVPADHVSYILTIKFMDIATDNAYVLKIGENEVTGPDGLNEWYKSEITAEPVDTSTYEIAKLNDNVTFSSQVVFGNVVNGVVQDQGSSTKKILLKDKTTGGISAPVEVAIGKMDTAKPDNLAIEFPEKTPIDSILFFKRVDITFTAYDATAGVTEFTWEYTKETGASSKLLGTAGGTLQAVQDEDDSTKYTAVLSLPRNVADQLRGNLKIAATDAAGNISDALTDTGVFVVDTVSPENEVSYSLVDNTKSFNNVGNIHYTTSDIKFDFKVTESNFYADDVEIKVSKNGATASKQTVAWEATGNEDEYKTSITLSGDGKYVVSMSYVDRSGNEMEEYISDMFVIDTTVPVIEFTYADNEDQDHPQTATIKISDISFNPENIVLEATAKDITGRSVQTGDLQSYVRNGNWSENNGVHTINISTAFLEGIYQLTLNYTDLSGNSAAEVVTQEFTVDRAAPDVSKMQIAYSSSIKDSILSALTFGYYRSNVTITFTAYDLVSGIDYITWEYSRQSGASESNVASYAQTKIQVTQDTTDKTKYTATATIPKSQADQIRGNVSFTATDKYGNVSDKKTDTNHVIIVDTIAPTIRAEYSAPEEKIDNKSFYNKPITATFTVTEANFYKEDVKVVLERKNGSTVQVEPNWSDNTADVHVGTYTIGDSIGDDEYTFNITYTDRSNNTMTAYKSDTMVLDTTAPTINVEYSNPVQTENGIAYYDGSIDVTMNIKEVNFNSADMVVTVTKDGTSFAPTVTWTTSEDENIGKFVLTEDGDYTITATYKDMATNAMEDYSSEQMVIDTELVDPIITINGEDGNGKAYKEEVIPSITFEDRNFASCEVTLVRTSYADKDVDVTEKFISGHLTINDNGGSGRFDTFEKVAENDGIYTLSVSLEDKAGHTIEKEVTFTVNRFGSVYEYSDYLISLIADGGAYVQKVDDDIVITEYNADKLLPQSLNIVISKDGKPVDDTTFSVTPEVNENVAIGESGWYQYQYTISKDNFATDGVYKVAISSEDATGNTPENSNYDDKGILFRVDSTVPEITSITGLEDKVVNATEQEVKYTVYDTIGLASVTIYVNDSELTKVTDFGDDYNNYEGAFVLAENSEAQKIRLVVTDKAGNVTDTSDEAFTSVYAFNDSVTVSTNIFVRLFANKTLVFGSIAGVGAAGAGGAGLTVFFRRRRLKVK